MAEFFTQRPSGEPGLALFLNAGDPPLPVLADVVRMLDEQRVDCLELAVPFPNSFTDGPVVRRSAERALTRGVGLPEVLGFLAEVVPDLHHLKIVLLVDWSHTVKPTSLPDFLGRVRDSAAHALLVHGLPPRLRPQYYDLAGQLRLPLVSTCYANSAPAVQEESARQASAYLYLVAHYGRSGTAPAAGYDTLAGVLPALRANTTAPIAVGFGVRDRGDVLALQAIGADAVIVGSAGVSVVDSCSERPSMVAGALSEFVRRLRPGLTHPVGRSAQVNPEWGFQQ